MQEIILKVRYVERGLSVLKNVTLFFLSNPDPFNRQNYQQQKGTSDQSLLLVMQYLAKFDDVI